MSYISEQVSGIQQLTGINKRFCWHIVVVVGGNPVIAFLVRTFIYLLLRCKNK